MEPNPLRYDLSAHPFLVASKELEDAFEGFRRDLLVPFTEPADSEAHFQVWHQSESNSRESCEEAIEHWIEFHSRPPLSDEAAYFLCRRFDQASNSLRNFVLRDGTSVISHDGLSFDEFMEWLLVDWWESHGIREAYFEDLANYEHRQNRDETV